MAKKILIVDDEYDLCEEASGYLIDQGYDAYYALDGKSGLDAIKEKRPNLLLLDIQMPNMNGLQMLKQIVELYPHLMVVIISGCLDAATTSMVVQYGAAVCIDKPFKLEELLEKVIKPLIGDGD